MKQLLYTLLILVYTEGVAQTPALDLSQTYQDRANWFRQMPQFNLDSISFYFDKAVDVLEKAQAINYKRLAEVYCNQADYYHLQVRVYDKSAEKAAKAWAYWDKIPVAQRDIALQYDILQAQAMSVIENGETNRALKLYTQAYELLYNNPKPEIQAKVLKDKAMFYIRYGLPEQRPTALAALMQSCRMYEQFNDTVKYCSALTIVYGHLANFYLNEKNYDSCMFYLAKNIAVERYVKNPYRAGWHNTIKAEALIYIKHDYDEAEKNIEEARRKLEKYNLTKSAYYEGTFFWRAEVANNKGQYDKAIEAYNQAIVRARESNFRQTVANGLRGLSEVYEKKKNYKQALHFHKQFHDTIIDVLNARSERSMKENELQLSVATQEKEVSKQRLMRNFFIICVGLLGLLAFVIYRNYRTQKKLNAILNIRNEEKEFLIKEIHHRVKNNLQVLSSLLHLQSKHIKDEAALDAVREGQNRVEAMGLIHQKLYMGDNLAAVEMKDYLKNLGDTLLDSFGLHDDRITIQYEVQSMHLDVDTAIPLGLIINELVTNSLKYAFPKNTEGSLVLSLWVNETKQLCLKVADNGVGKTDAPKLKNSTSFGTNLVQILSKKLRGTPEIVQQERGYGTLIQFDNYKMVTI